MSGDYNRVDRGGARGDSSRNRRGETRRAHPRRDAASPRARGERPRQGSYARTAAPRNAGVGAYSSRGQGDRRVGNARGAAPRARRSAAGVPPRAKLVCVGVLAALIAVVAFAWNTRSVGITLNGTATSVRVGSSVASIVSEKRLQTNPGDLVSVGGNVIEAGAGYAYSAKLGDEDLEGDVLDSYGAREGDALTISDGGDKTEDYDVSVEEEQPKLVWGGDAWGNITYISQWGRAGKREVLTGKVSGETAEGDVLEETRNVEVVVHQISPDDAGRKLIALTFDDGPADPYTEKYLEILDQYGIKATFFNLGQNIKEYPDLAKKIVDSGNELMSHTHQHQQLTKLDAASLQSEFRDAFDLIDSTTGHQTTSFRPPYGDFTEGSWLKSGGLASLSVLWNLDSEDWRRAGADSIVSKSTTGAFSGAIILMHDGGGDRTQDVEALPRIISTLQSEGYEFVTVGELMKSDSSIPAEVASGYDPMPADAVWPTEVAKG